MTITIGLLAASGAKTTLIIPAPVVTAPAQAQSLFTSQSPSIVDDTDGVDYELGLLFQAAVPGKITGIRYWKGPLESGSHTGKIYSEGGTLLASKVFGSGSGSGWQSVVLDAPLSITANTTYVVTVNTGGMRYCSTVGGLASQVVNGSLRSVVGANGVFGPVGSRPTQTWNGSNYFRDVIFEPGPPPAPDTQAPSVPTNLQAVAI